VGLPQRAEKSSGMVNINDTVMLSVIGDILDQDHVHTLHFRSLGVQPMDGLITEWVTGCATAYRGLFRLTDRCITVYRVAHICGSVPLDATVDVVPPGGFLAGSRPTGSENMPTYVASLVAEKGVSSGRRRQGRFFIGGMMEEDTLGNAVTAAHLGRLGTYCTALSSSFLTQVAPNWRLVVHSRTTALEGGNCQDSSTVVQALIPRVFPTTMRSRKAGHGG